MATEGNFLWSFSTISKATLLAGASTYNVELFTPQSDQTTPILQWHMPQRTPDGATGTERAKYMRYTKVLDYSKKADGWLMWSWWFGMFTPGQFDYIDTNQFSNGTLQSAPCTVQTFTDLLGGSYQVANAVVYRPEPGVDYAIQDGFYRAVRYRFYARVWL